MHQTRLLEEYLDQLKKDARDAAASNTSDRHQEAAPEPAPEPREDGESASFRPPVPMPRFRVIPGPRPGHHSVVPVTGASQQSEDSEQFTRSTSAESVMPDDEYCEEVTIQLDPSEY